MVAKGKTSKKKPARSAGKVVASSKPTQSSKSKKATKASSCKVIIPSMSSGSAFSYYANNEAELEAASARFRALARKSTAKKIRAK